MEDGEWIFVSGTTGFDYRSMTISDSLTEQTEQCLRNIQSALEQAGASLGDVRPAATMMSARLIDPRIQIEIEVTARRQAGG